MPDGKTALTLRESHNMIPNTIQMLERSIPSCSDIKIMRTKSMKGNPFDIAVPLTKVKTERKDSYRKKYEVQYLLGRGSYGEVQKVLDLETREYRAMKIINKNQCKEITRINDEIEILKQLVLYK